MEDSASVAAGEDGSKCATSVEKVAAGLMRRRSKSQAAMGRIQLRIDPEVTQCNAASGGGDSDSTLAQPSAHPEETAVPDLKPRPYYHADAFTAPKAVAERLKTASETDGATDYATRINLEILGQLAALRRHALVIATIVVLWAILTLIGFIVIVVNLTSDSSSLHY